MLRTENQTATITTDIAGVEGEPVITAVVEAIASLEDEDPTVAPRLYPSIDIDALNRLFTSAAVGQDEPLRVEFTHEEYHIIVENEPGLTVTVTRE